MTEKQKVTLSGRPSELPEEASAPAPIDKETGMHKDYWVLSEEEIQKGFVRPVRRAYKHKGEAVCGKVLPEEKLGGLLEVCTMKPNHEGECVVFRKMTQPEAAEVTVKQLIEGCGQTTKMALKIAETYARDPKFYGSTFCATCGTHFPVNQFRWEETDEIVGS